ncbi:MAG: PIG-L family deacetylase, partial [Bacteroidota bacterium]
IWLSQKVGKAILRLEETDFHQHHLHDLVMSCGNEIDELCRRVFEDLRQRVMYRTQLFKRKRSILFSPHPDDDVISMGGMLDKVVQNNNQLTVAYMTNGSVAVFDGDVRRHLRFVDMSHKALGLTGAEYDAFKKRKTEIFGFLQNKKAGEIDPEDIQDIKAHIRYAEAVAGIEVMGLDDQNARFLDMPFYKTGRVKKAPIGEEDIQIVLDLLKEIEPQHIFVAGDLSDPHGTHRMCYMAIKFALERYNEELEAAGAAKKQPLVWLYRGAWQEWEIDKADTFIPMSKRDLDRKIEAIFKHESQKDRAMFPGAYDSREFWERARDRNVETAHSLNALGLPEFYAAEAFVTVKQMP